MEKQALRLSLPGRRESNIKVEEIVFRFRHRGRMRIGSQQPMPEIYWACPRACRSCAYTYPAFLHLQGCLRRCRWQEWRRLHDGARLVLRGLEDLC